MSDKVKVDPQETVEITKQSLAMLMDCLTVAFSHLARHIAVDDAKAIVDDLKKEMFDGKK